MKKRLLFVSTLILTIFTLFLSFESANAASKKIDPSCLVLLKPGMLHWGAYECSNCDSWVPGKPNEKDQVHCLTCEKPHTTETVQKGIFKTPQGNMIFKAALKSEDEVRLRGFKVECPTCHAANFPVTREGMPRAECVECGDTLKKQDRLVEIGEDRHIVSMPFDAGQNADDIRESNLRVQRIKGTLQKGLLEERGSGVGVTIDDVNRELVRRIGEKTGNQVMLEVGRTGALPSSEPMVQPRKRKKPLRKDQVDVVADHAAATATAASSTPAVPFWVSAVQRLQNWNQSLAKKTEKIPAPAWLKQHMATIIVASAITSSLGVPTGVMVYGAQPLVYEGEVTAVIPGGIKVGVTNENLDFTLTFDTNYETKWEEGDQVWIHGHNFKWMGISGYEMENGDAYDVINGKAKLIDGMDMDQGIDPSEGF